MCKQQTQRVTQSATFLIWITHHWLSASSSIFDQKTFLTHKDTKRERLTEYNRGHRLFLLFNKESYLCERNALLCSFNLYHYKHITYQQKRSSHLLFIFSSTHFWGKQPDHLTNGDKSGTTAFGPWFFWCSERFTGISQRPQRSLWIFHENSKAIRRGMLFKIKRCLFPLFRAHV